jgi:hypothetical protein
MTKLPLLVATRLPSPVAVTAKLVPAVAAAEALVVNVNVLVQGPLPLGVVVGEKEAKTLAGRGPTLQVTTPLPLPVVDSEYVTLPAVPAVNDPVCAPTVTTPELFTLASATPVVKVNANTIDNIDFKLIMFCNFFMLIFLNLQ